MFEVAMLSMFLGGLSAIMQREGGLEWLIQRIYSLTRLLKVSKQRAGEFGISFLVVFSNLFVANWCSQCPIRGLFEVPGQSARRPLIPLLSLAPAATMPKHWPPTTICSDQTL